MKSLLLRNSKRHVTWLALSTCRARWSRFLFSLGCAAAIPLSAIHTLPIFTSAMGGGAWVLGRVKTRREWNGLCGTGFGIPASVVAGTLGLGIGATTGSSALLWQLARGTAQPLGSWSALAWHWIGRGRNRAGCLSHVPLRDSQAFLWQTSQSLNNNLNFQYPI